MLHRRKQEIRFDQRVGHHSRFRRAPAPAPTKAHQETQSKRWMLPINGSIHFSAFGTSSDCFFSRVSWQHSAKVAPNVVLHPLRGPWIAVSSASSNTRALTVAGSSSRKAFKAQWTAERSNGRGYSMTLGYCQRHGWGLETRMRVVCRLHLCADGRPRRDSAGSNSTYSFEELGASFQIMIKDREFVLQKVDDL